MQRSPQATVGSGHAGPPATHRPVSQRCPAGQAFPQRPQLRASSRRLVQAPLQLVVPSGHVTVTGAHRPAAHISPAAHARPQAPQWARSVSTFVQVPAQAISPAGQGAAVHRES